MGASGSGERADGQAWSPGAGPGLGHGCRSCAKLPPAKGKGVLRLTDRTGAGWLGTVFGMSARSLIRFLCLANFLDSFPVAVTCFRAEGRSRCPPCRPLWPSRPQVSLGFPQPSAAPFLLPGGLSAGQVGGQRAGGAAARGAGPALGATPAGRGLHWGRLGLAPWQDAPSRTAGLPCWGCPGQPPYPLPRSFWVPSGVAQG